MMANLYESAGEATLAEIVRQAESLLAAQLQAAIAADQRALTFSGLLVAAVAALAASAGTTVHPNAVIVVVATLLGLGAAAALWSARPTRWAFVGTEPHLWERDLLEQPPRPFHRSMAEMAAAYDAALGRNGLQMKRASWAMRVSMVMTAAALAVVVGWAWASVL